MTSATTSSATARSSPPSAVGTNANSTPLYGASTWNATQSRKNPTTRRRKTSSTKPTTRTSSPKATRTDTTERNQPHDQRHARHRLHLAQARRRQNHRRLPPVLL